MGKYSIHYLFDQRYKKKDSHFLLYAALIVNRFYALLCEWVSAFILKIYFVINKSVYYMLDRILFFLLILSYVYVYVFVCGINWTKTALDMCIALNCHTNIVFNQIWSFKCPPSSRCIKCRQSISTVFELRTEKKVNLIKW